MRVIDWNPNNKYCRLCGNKQFTLMDVELNEKHMELAICDACRMTYAREVSNPKINEMELLGFMSEKNYFEILINKSMDGELEIFPLKDLNSLS